MSTVDERLVQLRQLGFRTLQIDIDTLIAGLDPEDWDEIAPIVDRLLDYTKTAAVPIRPAVTASHEPLDVMYPQSGYRATEPPRMKRTS